VDPNAKARKPGVRQLSPVSPKSQASTHTGEDWVALQSTSARITKMERQEKGESRLDMATVSTTGNEHHIQCNRQTTSLTLASASVTDRGTEEEITARIRKAQ